MVYTFCFLNFRSLVRIWKSREEGVVADDQMTHYELVNKWTQMHFSIASANLPDDHTLLVETVKPGTLNRCIFLHA